MSKKETPFQDQKIPAHASMVVQAISELEDPEKVTLSALSDKLKELGLKDAYRKVQTLPRISPCRIDTNMIFQVYGKLENASASAVAAAENSTSTVEVSSDMKSSMISATHNPNHRKMIKTASYHKLERLLKGKSNLNIFIDGDTGLGKSTAVIDISKKQGKEVMRLNLSFVTDVDDLLGGFRLEGGDTVWQDGPVVVAMKRGARLLLDEMDAGNPKIMFELQSVLEGSGVFLKKINQMVYPTEGFQVLATGNTKGRGDMTGDFSGTSILNKAFLDRFAASITFVPPTVQEMKKILKGEKTTLTDTVTDALAAWYGQVLEARDSGVVTHILSTRRMVAITNLASDFGVKSVGDDDLKEAVDYATNGYDEELKEGFKELLDRMIDLEKEKSIPQATSKDVFDDDSPF